MIMYFDGGKGATFQQHCLHAHPPAHFNPAKPILILLQVQLKMKLTLVAFAILAAMVAVSAQHPCYSKDQDSCKQDSNCAYNFVHSCCSPSNGPVCAHHASLVHSIPQVYPTSVNHPTTNKPLAPWSTGCGTSSCCSSPNCASAPSIPPTPFSVQQGEEKLKQRDPEVACRKEALDRKPWADIVLIVSSGKEAKE